MNTHIGAHNQYLRVGIHFLQAGRILCYFRHLIVTGRQLKAARALIGMEQTDLADKAGVAIGTVRRMESFDGEIAAHTATLLKVQKALEKAGVEFLNHERPGVRMRQKR